MSQQPTDEHINPGMPVAELDKVAREVYGSPYASLSAGSGQREQRRRRPVSTARALTHLPCCLQTSA